jgi:hypothetical protein
LSGIDVAFIDILGFGALVEFVEDKPDACICYVRRLTGNTEFVELIRISCDHSRGI